MRNARLLIAVCSLAVLAVSGFGQTTPPPPALITVSGNGTVRADPDMATVRLGVQAQAKNAKDAQAQASATASKILDAISKLGIERKDIQTTSLTLYPVFAESRPGQTTAPAIVAFRAQNTVIVRVNDLTKVGPVVDASVTAGSNEVQSVDFGLKNDEAARRESLKKAVAEAKAKAEAMAEALGVKVGDVYEANEGMVQVMPMPMMSGRVAFAADAGGTPVAPGQLDVTATVRIRFRIVFGGR